MLFSAIYYIAKWGIDKYQIVHQYSKPHFAYGRRARATTTYMLFSMAVGRIGDVIYYMAIRPGDDNENVPYGYGFLFVCVMAFLSLFTYTNRNKIFSKDTMSQASSVSDQTGQKAKKLADLKQKSMDAGVGDAGEDFYAVYDPPSFENLKRGQELDANLDDKTTNDNPINEGFSELTIA